MQELKLGSKGPDVVVWQNFLNNRGIHVTPDGDFGPNTADGTRLWQSRALIAVTGVVDDATITRAADLGFQQDVIAPVISNKVISVPPESKLALFPTVTDRVTQINEAKLTTISPAVARRVRSFIAEAMAQGVRLQIVQGLRTFAEQDALYAQGRTRPGKIVTNARGGQSLHNYGVAVDMAPVVHNVVTWDNSWFKDYKQWAADTGLDWGGNWKSIKDMPHVQDTDHMNLARVQSLYRQGGLAQVWANVT